MKEIGTVLLCIFLLVTAGQDLRRKSVEVRVYLVFGVAAVVWNGMYVFGMRGTPGEGTILGDLLMRRLTSCGVGILLLIIGKASRGGIGAGDGCFFLVSGLLLDPWQNFWLLAAGIFLCGGYSLWLFVRARFRDGQNIGKATLPFLPFVAVAGAAGLAAGVIG